MPKGKKFILSKVQKKLIREQYLSKSLSQIARELSVPRSSVPLFLKQNNLSIPEAISKKRIAASRFKKGQTSYNKGLKIEQYMSPEGIEESKKTRFKKGHIPYNTKSGLGEVVSRKESSGRIYKWYCYQIGKWVLLHHKIWEDANGLIPKGCLIVFKDKDSTNVVLENLELISKKENMLRNSKHNFPEEIIPSMVLINQLQTKLNKLQNGKKHTIRP